MMPVNDRHINMEGQLGYIAMCKDPSDQPALDLESCMVWRFLPFGLNPF